MENLSRTVRFRKEEIRTIEEFLFKNPFFDFSTLTRLAISEFIKNPRIQVLPVRQKKPAKKTVNKGVLNV